MDSIKFYMNNIVEKINNNHPSLKAEGKEIEKNNGVIMHGIVIRTEGSNVAPTIYVDEYYRKETPVSVAAVDIYELYKNNMISNVDTSFFTDYEKVKKNLKAKLVNESNDKYAGISAKDYGFSDLKIVPYIDVEGIDGIVTVLPCHLEFWNVSIDDVVDQALDNIKNDVTFTKITKYLGLDGASDVMLDIMFFGLNDMYVVSNNDFYYGAITAIVGKDKIIDHIHGDYVVIPCSIHEVIVVPKGIMNSGDILDMVLTVNRDCILPQDKLSDNVYEIAV